MVRLSLLPLQSIILGPKQQQILERLTDKVVVTYENFFKNVKVIPVGFEHTRSKTFKRFRDTDFKREDLDAIEKKLVNMVNKPIITGVLPVNIHLNCSIELDWYTGIGIMEGTAEYAEFYLHRFLIKTMSLRYSSGSLNYLDKILEEGSESESVSPRKLAAKYGKNYNQFQKDCKNHFGDTFHQFQNKMKMLDVVGDILFTNYSLKEIAYRNHFSNYNSMYILFHKKYRFPIDSIPRLLTEI